MVRTYLILLLTLVSTSATQINLVSDPGFESLGAILGTVYNSGNQQFSYRQVVNGQSQWYSLISGKIKIRSKNDLNTIVMQTLNNNRHEKICRNFTGQNNLPYELSFDYLIDENIFSALLHVSFNDQIVLYSLISNRQSYSLKQTVYLNEDINVLCFQSSVSSESLAIGGVVDNITLIPFIQSTIVLDVFGMEQANLIRMSTTLWLQSYDYLYEIQSNMILTIQNVQYTVNQINIDSNNCLYFIIQIYQQYASSLTSIYLQVPNKRGSNNQITTYKSSPTKMPTYMFQSSSDLQILSESKNYLVQFTKTYYSIFLVIKILSFCFVGSRFLHFYYIFMIMYLIDLQFILPAATEILNQIGAWTINVGTISFFAKLIGKQPPLFGSEYFKYNFTKLEGTFEVFGLTENVFLLIFDNFIWAIFNIIKIMALYYLIFKDKPKILRVLIQIKNEKILFQFIYVFSIVALVLGFVCRNGLSLHSFEGKINRQFCICLPIIAVFLSFCIFTRQTKRLTKSVKKIKKLGNKNKERYDSYRAQTLLNLTQHLMLLIIPFSIGFGNAYLSTVLFFILETFKLIFIVIMCKNSPSFVQFWCVISSIIKFLLAVSLLLVNIFSSLPSLSSNVELGWISFLKYNSYFLVFGLMVGGFIEICCCSYHFVTGLFILKWSTQNIQIQSSVKQTSNFGSKAGDELEQIENVDFGLQGNSSLGSIDKRNSIELSKASRGEQIQNPFSPKSRKKVLFQKSQSDQKSDKTISKSQKNSNPSSKSISEGPTCKIRKIKKMLSISRFLETNETNSEGEDDYQQKTSERPRVKSSSEIEQDKPTIVKKARRAYNQRGLKIIKRFDPSLRQITERSQGPDTLDNIPSPSVQNQSQNFS